MENHLDPAHRRLANGHVAQVALEEFDATPDRVHVFSKTGRQVVDDPDSVSQRDQPLGDV
jgi:hypothetical protein